MGKVSAPVCDTAASDALTIASPVDGARFILEPHRPAHQQRPILRAIPNDPKIRWSIDGVLAQDWTPRPGRYTVLAQRGDRRDQVQIEYE